MKSSDGVVLWSRPIQGGEESQLEHMPKLRYDEAWTASAAGIYFVRNEARRSAIQFYDFALRSARHVAWIAERPLPLGGLGLSVSDDGRWMLFAHSDRAESDVMLMERP